MSKDNGSMAKLSPGQPKNILEMQELARTLYGTGRKFEGIGALCDCIMLLSAGIKRQFEDNKALTERVEALEKQLNEKDSNGSQQAAS
jgi:hypothetical protein